MAIFKWDEAAKVAKVVEATCSSRGYTETVDDGAGNQVPNIPPAQWARRWWQNEMRAEVRNFEQANIIKSGTYSNTLGND